MRLHGTFATLLLMVPVLSIPALAIFGIPQFAPVVASPLDEDYDPDDDRRTGKLSRSSGDDFESDMEDAPEFGADLDRNESPPRRRQGESVPVPRQRRFEPPPETPRWHNENNLDNKRFDPEYDSSPQARQPYVAGSESDLHQSRPSAPKDFDRFQDGPLPSIQPGTATHPNSADMSKDSGGKAAWQSAMRRLKELQIRNFRLQPGSGGEQFIFICTLNPSDSPNLTYRFEAEDVEPLKAVEKVLVQITEWQQKR